MEGKDSKPPKIASTILRRIVNSNVRYGAMGDFEENFNKIAGEKGPARARIYYWSEIAAALPGFMFNSVYWGAEMFKNHLVIAVRNIRRHRAYSFINISGLAIGMSCAIMIMLWVKDELGYDRFHRNERRIYRVVSESVADNKYMIETPCPMGYVLSHEYPDIEKVVRLQYRSNCVVRSGDSVFMGWNGAAADPSIFDVFTFPLSEGDSKTALSEINSIVLSREKAVACFGGDKPIGKMIEMEGDLFKVTGILKEIPDNSEIRFDFVRPFKSLRDLEKNRDFIWNWFSFETFVLLKEKALPGSVDAQISDILNANRPWSNTTLRTFLQPLGRMHLYRPGGGGPIKYVAIFSLIAASILLIACINFMNLSTARSAGRAREVGIRKVLGSDRKQIMRQFFGESLLLASISLLIATGIVSLALPWFGALSGKHLHLNYLDPGTILDAIAMVLITGLFSGFYPAMLLSAIKPAHVLKGKLLSGPAHGPTSAGLFRKVLVVVQFSLSIGLIICTAVLYQQLNFMRFSDLGFNEDNLVRLSLSDEARRNFEPMRNELSQNPAILKVAAAGRTSYGVRIEWEGMPGDEEFLDRMGSNCAYTMIDTDYLDVLEMEMLGGRSFSKDYPSDERGGYLINEEAARLWKMEEPVGKGFSLNNRGTLDGTVVGMFKNKYIGLKNPAKPEIYYLTPKTPWDKYDYFYMRINGDMPAQALAHIKTVWDKFNPGMPPELIFIDEMIGEQYRFEVRLGRLFNIFTFLAVFISCLGLFGLASYVAEQRTKEIGVRKVLGASIINIVTLLINDFGKWIVLSNLIAWPVAWFAMHKWLQEYPYRISIDAWLFPAAGLLALAIAVLSVSWQAFRAASANPIDSLKYE